MNMETVATGKTSLGTMRECTQDSLPDIALHLQYVDRKDMPDQRPEIETDQSINKKRPSYDRFERRSARELTESTGIYELTYENGRPKVVAGQPQMKKNQEQPSQADATEESS